MADREAGRDLTAWCADLLLGGAELQDELFMVCMALHETSLSGRTSPQARQALQRYLQESGALRATGYMIANHGDGTYEVQIRRVTERPAPGKTVTTTFRNHSILRTTVTTFTSQGRFDMWVRRDGSREVETVNGFTQTWAVFEEDALGGMIDHIRRASAGEETAQTAREAFIALVEANL